MPILGCMRHSFTVLFFGAMLLAGCASSPLDESGSHPFTNPSQLTALPAHPYAETYPLAQVPQPPAKALPEAHSPIPIWENTQIQKVMVDAYVDEKGNLHPESHMYVVTKKGGWNLDAVRKPDGYIPPGNAAKPLDGLGIAYGMSSALPKPAEEMSPSMALLGGGNIRITGYTDKGDAAKAREMSNPAKEVAIYDPKLGWVIVAKNVMASEISAPNAHKIIPPRREATDESGRIGSLAIPPKESETQMEDSIVTDLFNEF